MSKPSKSDKRNQRAAAKKNAKAAAAVAAKNNNPPAPPPIASAEPLENNELCETCGLWGTVLCCDKCIRVFHLECTQPQLDFPPVGEWYCQFCIAYSNETIESEKQAAQLFAEEITTLKRQAISKRNGATTNDADGPATKRTRVSPPQTTTSPSLLQTATSPSAPQAATSQSTCQTTSFHLHCKELH